MAVPIRHHYRRAPHLPAAYPGQIDLFTSFWLAAHWVWERPDTAKRFGMPFSEETITDAILLDLAGLNATQPPSANAGLMVTPSSVTVRSVRGKP